jgi:hypothetical protein
VQAGADCLRGDVGNLGPAVGEYGLEKLDALRLGGVGVEVPAFAAIISSAVLVTGALSQDTADATPASPPSTAMMCCTRRKASPRPRGARLFFTGRNRTLVSSALSFMTANAARAAAMKATEPMKALMARWPAPHGAVIVQGFESWPVDETKVRVRPAAVAGSDSASVVVRNANGKTVRVMDVTLLLIAGEFKSQADVLQPAGAVGCHLRRARRRLRRLAAFSRASLARILDSFCCTVFAVRMSQLAR